MRFGECISSVWDSAVAKAVSISESARSSENASTPTASGTSPGAVAAWKSPITTPSSSVLTVKLSVSVNGEDVDAQAEPGSYVTLDRRWSDGDTIELKMPFSFRLERLRDQPNIASIFFGPVLLAARESEARSDWRKITLDTNDIANSIKGDPRTLRFMIDGIQLEPFFDSHDRYSVYFDVTMGR